MIHLAKYGSAQVICEVGWARQGWTFRKEVTREAYLRDLAYAEELLFPVREWRGKDRAGKPLHIVWVTTGVNGALLSAYEVQDRCETLAPGTRVTLNDPGMGTWHGRVVVCLCKRHVWQQELPGGAGPGRECGHARCGFPAAADACPWPVHVEWNNGNESHESPQGLTPA